MAIAPLTIGIDATTWWNRRGFGRFTRSLLGAMIAEGRGHQFVLFVDRSPAPEMLAGNVRVVVVDTSATVTDAAVADGNRSIADLLRFRKAVSATPLDIFWFPAVYSWYPTGGRTAVVVTFHDAIAEHFSNLVMPGLRNRIFWNLKTRLARASAKQIVTVSQSAREELQTYMRIPRERISVVFEAADARFAPVTDPVELKAMRRALNLSPGRRRILYVGGIAPHKNLSGLVEAFARTTSQPGCEDVDLVIAGDPAGDGFHSSADQLLATVSRLGLAARIHFTGFVPDDLLAALYSDAMVVAMPAFSEGFGLPAAEAIACGTPVIATGGGAVAEVVGKAGLFFDPHDRADMARVISTVARDKALMARLRQACLPRAREMSWQQSASAMLDLLERCAAPG